MATIIVVDDHADNRGVIQAVLAPFGHHVAEAGDGAAGLALARTMAPDLIIADILMPSMDGYEFVRRLRADPALAAIPVVFYTAYFHNREARQLARECGVRHLITKPCEPADVLRTVEAVLADVDPSVPPPAPDPGFEVAQIRLFRDHLSRTADDLLIANQRLLALHEGNLKLASERDPLLILQGFCDAVRRLVGAQHALVVAGYNGNGPGGREPCIVASGMDDTILAGLDGARIEETFARLAGDGQGVLHLAAAHAATEFAPLVPGLSAPRTLLLTALRSPHRVYGWAGLFNKVGATDFVDDDARILDTIAQLTGRIYENGSLYAELNRRAAELEREVVVRTEAEARIARLHRFQSLLSSINGLIVRVRERRELFDEACHIAVRHGGFASAWIGILDASRDALDWVAAAGRDLPDAVPWPVVDTSAGKDRRRAIVAHAIATRAPVHDDDAITGLRRPAARQYQSAIALPLRLDDEVVGVYALFADECGVFNAEERRTLSELAGDISFALDYMAKAAQAEHLAYFDPITGLPNRRLFFDHLTQALHGATPRRRVVLVIGDIKHFRAINESHGLTVGDTVLRQVAERLAAWSDNPENLARIAGDRFATFLPDVHDATDVALRIERFVHDALRTPITVGDSELRLGFALGVALHPQDGTDAETLFHNAEAALARAKATGERYRFYEPSLNARIAETLQLESRLRRAIEHDEFVLHYQPKVNARCGAVTGVEALIRWQDPERGLVPPGEFIRILEESGLIVEVGNWALVRAAQDYMAWRAAGLAAPRIAVNISPAQLRHRAFVEHVMLALEPLQGHCVLDLEITESMLIDEYQETVERLNVVRGLGVEIALDDFGTGYSSLAHIARLPINAIKIDRSFIDEMLYEPYSRNLVTMIIGLAHTLGLEVIAEGVENAEQADFLRELGCDALQGYLVSRPLPAEAFADYLRGMDGRTPTA